MKSDSVFEKILGFIKYVCNCVLDLIYYNGQKCCLCSNNALDDMRLCGECYSKIKYCVSDYYIEKDDIKIKTYCAAYYTGVVKELVRNFKYKSDFESGKVLAKLMIKNIEKYNIQFDYITFVPMIRKDKIKRGYNQSEFLARYIGKEKSVKVLKILEKKKISRDQIGLNEEERWNNLKDCFRLNSDKEIKGKNILLVDDVLTTGATSFYCSELILNKDAENIIVLTAAKSKL